MRICSALRYQASMGRVVRLVRRGVGSTKSSGGLTCRLDLRGFLTLNSTIVLFMTKGYCVSVLGFGCRFRFRFIKSLPFFSTSSAIIFVLPVLFHGAGYLMLSCLLKVT